MNELNNIKYWLFDLDNTLYDGATKVFEQVDKKMTKFISEKLKVNKEEARKIQKNYFQEYNTTLNGMIKNHKIDADEFLEFVHDVDLNFLNKDELLEDQIRKLNGKKIIFTNGSRAHAENVTKRIGIDKLFDGIFDIRGCLGVYFVLPLRLILGRIPSSKPVLILSSTQKFGIPSSGQIFGGIPSSGTPPRHPLRNLQLS